MYIDGWRENISTTMNCKAERSARDQALLASTNDEMITIRTSLIDMQTKIQANANQGNKNTDHINILNNYILFVKRNVDKITLKTLRK